MDNHVQALKINTETVLTLDSVRDKHAVISQNTFRRVLVRVESRGMVVNTSKTGILCVSDALSFRAEGHIYGADDTQISSDGTTSLKILGFHFSKTPTVHAHVESLRRRFFSQWWILYHLKHHGFNREELVTVYKSIIRLVFDYCAVVYHTLLTDCLLYTSPSPRDS